MEWGAIAARLEEKLYKSSLQKWSRSKSGELGYPILIFTVPNNLHKTLANFCIVFPVALSHTPLFKYSRTPLLTITIRCTRLLPPPQWRKHKHKFSTYFPSNYTAGMGLDLKFWSTKYLFTSLMNHNSNPCRMWRPGSKLDRVSKPWRAHSISWTQGQTSFEGLPHLERSMGPHFFLDIADMLSFWLQTGDSPNSPNSACV